MGYAVKLQRGVGVNVIKIGTEVKSSPFNVKDVYDKWSEITNDNFIIAYTGVGSSAAQYTQSYNHTSGYVYWSSGFSYSYDASTGLLTLSNIPISYSGYMNNYVRLYGSVAITLDIYVVN